MYNTAHVLPHPLQSPDLNPIEHKISSKNDLKKALMEGSEIKNIFI